MLCLNMCNSQRFSPTVVHAKISVHHHIHLSQLIHHTIPSPITFCVSHHTLYSQPSALYRLTLSVTLENYALIQSQCAHYTHICHSLSIALFLVCCSLRKVVVILRCPASWSSKSKTSMLVGKKVDILKVRAPHLI